MYTSPPIVVEQALNRAGIQWMHFADGRQGVFTADCWLCHNGSHVVMQWLGDEFLLKCQNGYSEPELCQALGIAPDELGTRLKPHPTPSESSTTAQPLPRRAARNCAR